MQALTDVFAAEDNGKHCVKVRWAISPLPECFHLYAISVLLFEECFHISLTLCFQSRLLQICCMWENVNYLFWFLFFNYTNFTRLKFGTDMKHLAINKVKKLAQKKLGSRPSIHYQNIGSEEISYNYIGSRRSLQYQNIGSRQISYNYIGSRPSLQYQNIGSREIS